jgi:predicted metalloprotease with PDZ domain
VRDDKTIQALNKKFVLMRVTRMNGVNLNHFTFDYDLSWMGFFLSPDGKIYGRYGGRGPDRDERVSVEALGHTMEAILDHHQAEMKKPAMFKMPAARTVEDHSVIKPFLAKNKNACIHCHTVNEADNAVAMQKNAIKHGSLWSYPVPEAIGLTMDAVKGTTVAEVAESSPAAKAGLQAGDVLLAAKDVPLFSIYDIQVALHGVGDKAKLAVDVQRSGKQEKLTLDLSGDWRRWDISWRKSIEHFRPNAGFVGASLDKNAKAKLKIPADGLAFKLKSVNAATPAGKAGLQADDIVVDIGTSKRKSFYQELNAYCPAEAPVGTRVKVVYLRNGKEQETTVVFR